MRAAIEARLSKWKRSKESEAALALHQKDIVVAGDISGFWLNGNDMALTSLKLFPIGPNTYKILFSAGGCLGHWRLERTGVYKDGVLLLNRPVEEYGSSPYDRLFTIRTPAGIRLISEFAMGWYRKEHGPDLVSFLTFKNTTQSSAAMMGAKKKVVSPTPKPPAQPMRL
ncbi:MAG: hypothetical protein QM758_14060 [Armatimonas sp.]